MEQSQFTATALSLSLSLCFSLSLFLPLSLVLPLSISLFLSLSLSIISLSLSLSIFLSPPSLSLLLFQRAKVCSIGVTAASSIWVAAMAHRKYGRGTLGIDLHVCAHIIQGPACVSVGAALCNFSCTISQLYRIWHYGRRTSRVSIVDLHDVNLRLSNSDAPRAFITRSTYIILPALHSRDGKRQVCCTRAACAKWAIINMHLICR